MVEPDEPVVTLEDRIHALEVELARLRETPGTLGWPNDPTIAQGFAAHRWQRRDGDGYQEPLPKIPEAPSDSNYYGRHDFGWSPVVPLAGNVTMTGPLIVDNGLNLTSVGLGVGDAGTGLLRAGGALVLANAGQMVMQFLSDRTAMMVVQLNMALNKIANVADATAPADALNLRTADARYVRLDAADGEVVSTPSGGSENAKETEPSGAGRSQRTGARSRN